MEQHHVYFVFADDVFTSGVPKEYAVPSVDVEHVVSDRFSIDDARSLTERAQQKPFVGEKHVFVIITKDSALEAQNALLKLFEEPPASALFYVVIPNTAFILPTLRSRVAMEQDVKKDEPLPTSVFFSEFLRASYAERLQEIADKTKVKDMVWVEEIIRGTEIWITTTKQKDSELLKALLLVRTYIGSKGASVKMLLEELALLLPAE